MYASKMIKEVAPNVHLLGVFAKKIFRKSFVFSVGEIVKETIGVGVNEKAVLRFYQTALSFTSISIFPW